MTDKRQHIRTPISLKVKIIHPAMGEILLTTRDVSDGGVFLWMDGDTHPAIGTILEGQVQGPLGDQAPIVRMEVVRFEDKGVGLRFIDDLNA